MDKIIPCNIRILAKVEFPDYFAVKMEYTMEIDGEEVVQTFWRYFFDGFPAKYGLFLN